MKKILAQINHNYLHSMQTISTSEEQKHLVKKEKIMEMELYQIAMYCIYIVLCIYRLYTDKEELKMRDQTVVQL